MIVDPRFALASNCMNEQELFLEIVGAISSLSGGVNSEDCSLTLANKSMSESAIVEIPDGMTFR